MPEPRASRSTIIHILTTSIADNLLIAAAAMAKRTTSEAGFSERGGADDDTTPPTTSYSCCEICRKQGPGLLVQDCRQGGGGIIHTSQSQQHSSTSTTGRPVVHLSCLVNNARDIAQYTTTTARNNHDDKNNNQESNLTHMSNSFHDLLDTCGKNDSTRIFDCLSYTFLLSNLDRMIESERFLERVVDTSHRLLGSGHSCTQAAELAARQKKLRFVIVEYGVQTCVFRALGYVDNDKENCMVQGPINNNNNNNTAISGEQQQQQFVFPSNKIIPTLGTPVICHGYHAHLNGKIGDVRSIDRETGECEVHFEIITMEPQKIKAKYLRVLFDLPECQNLDYRFTTDEVIGNGRYKLIQRVGKGSFGQVVNAMDMQTNTEVAIKIIKRSAPRQNFMLQAQTEIKVLTQIHSKDPRGQHCIVRLMNTFKHKHHHQCLVFEPLSTNLYQLLVQTKFRGLDLDVVRKIARQLLKALAYLARPDIDIIHCDLKPENIMLKDPERFDIKLIDFGSACKSNEQSYTYIQSRFYRSPEVILGLPYSVAIDMWSLGCMLVELYTGDPLFAGLDEVEMMQKFVTVLAMPPDEMIHQVSKKRQRKFFQKKDGKWTIKQSKGGKTKSITPSNNPMASLKEAISRACRNKEKSKGDNDGFVEMILQMLTYQPQNRIRPDQSLQHPFIVETVNVYESKR